MKELEFGPAEYIMELQLVRSICIFSALQQTLERAISLALSVSLYVLDGWGIQWGGGGVRKWSGRCYCCWRVDASQA